MPAPQYVCETEGAVTLASATAKTIVGAKAHANSGLLLLGFAVSFDGVTPGATPVACEVMACDGTTNFTIGTNNTSTTPRQVLGRTLAAGFTSGKNWTAEPTVLTAVFPEFYLSVYQTSFVYNFPLGTEPDQGLSPLGFVIRCTTVAGSGTPNVRGGLIVARA